MIEKIAALAEKLAALPEACVDFNTFPTGSAMLDVRCAGHLYVFAYSPDQGFAVDEVGDDDGFLISYRFTCTDFEPAAARLWELVTGMKLPLEEAHAREQPTGSLNDHPSAANTKQDVHAEPKRP